jgi:hypothetical protein
MPDFLTRRNGTWDFVRRVPAEFAPFDRRGVVRHSIKMRGREQRVLVASNGVRAVLCAARHVDSRRCGTKQ